MTAQLSGPMCLKWARSGHRGELEGMSALPPKADIGRLHYLLHSRVVGIGDFDRSRKQSTNGSRT
jgi:hypothetical protein